MLSTTAQTRKDALTDIDDFLGPRMPFPTDHVVNHMREALDARADILRRWIDVYEKPGYFTRLEIEELIRETKELL